MPDGVSEEERARRDAEDDASRRRAGWSEERIAEFARRREADRERRAARSGGEPVYDRATDVSGDYAEDAEAAGISVEEQMARVDARNRAGPYGKIFMDMAARAPGAEELTPEYEELEALPEIGTDREGLQAQRDALAAMQDVYQSDGMTNSARAGMAARQRSVAQAERAQREAVQREAASRGMLGSGLDYAGQQMAVQGGANALADMEAQAMADAENRALSAMQSAGGLGSTMRGQGDAIASFNASYLRDVAARNTAIRNMGEDRRVGAVQQGFENDRSTTQIAGSGAPTTTREGNRAESAVSGAASGAATGATFGPWGALLGGLGGGALGYLSGHDDEEVEGW